MKKINQFALEPFDVEIWRGGVGGGARHAHLRQNQNFWYEEENVIIESPIRNDFVDHICVNVFCISQ